MLPRLEKSVCGCTLYTGSLIIAWLGFLGSVFGFLLMLVLGGAVVNKVIDNDIATQPTPTPDHQANEDAATMVVTVVFAIMLVIFIGSVLINTCLLVGVYKRNHCLMMPYMIIAGIGICLNAIGILVYFVMCFIHPSTIPAFISKLFGTVISGYCWLIVYNFWREVKEEEVSTRQQQTTFNKL